MYKQDTPLDAVSISDLTLDYILDADGQPHLHLLGGKGLYAAVGMWLWGLRVGLAVSPGCDFDLTHLQPLSQAGIDVRGVQLHPTTTTLCWAQQYGPDGERLSWNPHRHYAGLADPPVDPASLPDIDGISPSFVVRAHHVDLTGLPDAYITAAACHFAGDEFLRYPESIVGWKERGTLLTLDADWYSGPALTEASAAAALAPLVGFGAILPSREDVAHLFGLGVDVHFAARTIGQCTGALVAVKLGVAGSLVYQPRLDCFDHIPIVPVIAVDPTGAGDAYAGGFLAGLLKTGDPLEAALWATVSASFVVEGYGAAFALERATADERDRRLAVLRQQTADR